MASLAVGRIAGLGFSNDSGMSSLIMSMQDTLEKGKRTHLEKSKCPPAQLPDVQTKRTLG